MSGTRPTVAAPAKYNSQVISRSDKRWARSILNPRSDVAPSLPQSGALQVAQCCHAFLKNLRLARFLPHPRIPMRGLGRSRFVMHSSQIWIFWERFQSVMTDEEWSKRLNLYVYLYAINLSLELDIKTSSLYRPFNIVMQIYKQNIHDLIPTCVNVQRFKTVDMANHKH